jgi:hypothetical protein
MYSPHLDKKYDFNDPTQRKAFEDSYRGTVGESSRSPLAQDSTGRWYFNEMTDQANRNTADAQNNPEAPFDALRKKAAIAREAYDKTSADIRDVTGNGFSWIEKLFGDSINQIKGVKA